jgi:hypothetical protein
VIGRVGDAEMKIDRVIARQEDAEIENHLVL